jgi:proteasome lid subunit RPN8/RPN11
VPRKVAISGANIMKTEVRLKRGALSHFRKLARNSPNELMALLIGEVVNAKLTVVDSFEYAKEYAESSPSRVVWYQSELERVQKKAEARGRCVVGLIHSHPEWDAVMSSADSEVLLYYGYRVCGIVSIHDRKTRTRFWVSDSSLPCEIKYAKAKNKNVC